MIRIAALSRSLEAEEESSEQAGGKLEARLARLRKRFESGDITEEAYLPDSSETNKNRLELLRPTGARIPVTEPPTPLGGQ